MNATTKATKPLTNAQQADFYCDECKSSAHVDFYRLGTGKSRQYEVHCCKCGNEWEVNK